jgi:hypothetical protein
MHLSLKPAQSMQGENEERWEWVECWGKTSAKIAGVFSLPPSSALLRLIDRNARFGEEEQARPKGQGRAGTSCSRMRRFRSCPHRHAAASRKEKSG